MSYTPLVHRAKTFGDMWVYGMPMKLRGSWYMIYTSEKGFEQVRIKEATICVASTHFDMHQHRIFTGDVFKIKNSRGNEYLCICRFGNSDRKIVGFDRKQRSCQITGIYYEVGQGRHTFPIIVNHEGKNDTEIMELVGNIYDTPELEKEVTTQIMI